jgi:hypothetical protein
MERSWDVVLQRLTLAAAGLAGLAFGVWLLPDQVIDPRAWRWLLEGDAAQHFLGWRFFRDEPWQWPPGRLIAYGEAMGSSIVFTDSIPLLAMIGKLFAAWLPADFQYAGPWMVACYVLAALFAWRCGMLATGNVVAALVLALIVVLMPIIMVRTMAHFALAGQWLILWALSLYLDPRREISMAQRVACVVVAAGVHAYLLVLVVAVLGADLARRWLVERHVGFIATAVRGGVIGACLLLAAYLYGYFVVSDPGGGHEYYGPYGADIDAWFASLDGARFAPHWPASGSRGLEGVHYLGAGVWLSLLLVSLLAARQHGARLRRHWPLALACAGLAAMAATHQIGFGGRTVMEVPVSEWLLGVLATLRGSGRLLWLADIVLVLAAVVLPFRVLAPQRAALWVTLCLAVQVLDLAPPLNAMRAHLDALASRTAQTTIPDSPFWHEAAGRYRRLSLAPMTHALPGWVPLGMVAVQAGWSIDVGQFARAPWSQWQGARAIQLQALDTGLILHDTVYVITDPSLLNLDMLPPGAALGQVDGWWVLAPGWTGCCIGPPRDDGPFARRGRSAPSLRIEGVDVDVGIGLFEDRWAGPSVAMAMTAHRAGTIRLHLRFPDAVGDHGGVHVTVDGRPFTPERQSPTALEIRVPVVVGSRRVIRIDADRYWVPARDGRSADQRVLAWHLDDAALLP